MAAKYWLKLYHEMLDDRKVARLPDSSYRRFIECLLLAGELDEGGMLPPLPDMAWRLRIDDETLAQDMSRLAMAELVEIAENGRWLVTSFEKRQRGLSKAEYMKRLRDERRVTFEEKGGDVTNSNGDRYQSVTISKTDKIRLDKIRLDKDEDTDVNKTQKTIHTQEYIPNEIQELISSIASICKTPLWPDTEQQYSDAAYYLLGLNDFQNEQVAGFSNWWDAHGQYDGKPALKSILSNWQDFRDGVIPKYSNGSGRKKKAGFIPDEYADIIKR